VSATDAAVALEVLHVDMDCFFAAVEALDDPALAGRPVIVGGTGPRGVVASCSYEARASGVRSAMPMAQARRLCPEAVVLPGRHARYAQVGALLHETLQTFTPLVERVGLDEAFLDVSGAHRLFGTSEQIARRVRDDVRAALRLSCSVGVARTKLVAKLASREAKPRPGPGGRLEGAGVVVVPRSEELAFLSPRPVRDLWGVGPRTAEELARLGVRTIGELARVPRATLERRFGRALGAQLAAFARGEDARPVTPGRPTRSMGHEETFAADVEDAEEIVAHVLRIADAVGGRLRAARLAGRTVTLKVRSGDFRISTRALSLEAPVATGASIGRVAKALLATVETGAGVRLLGVAVGGLVLTEASGATQLSLVDVVDGGPPGGSRAREEALDAALAEVRRRYGAAAVGRAGALREGRLRVAEPGARPWGPLAPR
jgi:DNA polymerase-4